MCLCHESFVLEKLHQRYEDVSRPGMSAEEKTHILRFEVRARTVRVSNAHAVALVDVLSSIAVAADILDNQILALIDYSPAQMARTSGADCETQIHTSILERYPIFETSPR